MHEGLRAQIRAYAGRPWAEVEDTKRRHQAARARVEGAEAALALLEGMVEHANVVRPPFPTEQERKEDLEHHLEWRRRLDRLAHGLPVR